MYIFAKYSYLVTVKYYYRFLIIFRSFEGQTGEICFISENPNYSISRISKNLIKKGYKVTLIFRSNANFDLQKSFSKIIKVNTQYEALYHIKKINFKIIHCFSNAGDKFSFHILNNVRNAIFQPTDIIQDISFISQEFKDLQKKSLILASKIVCRDLSIFSNKITKAIAKTKPIIFFPEYLEQINYEKKLSGVHIVSVGNINAAPSNDEDLMFTFVKKFIEKGGTFHLYPHWEWNKLGLKKFKEAHSLYAELEGQTDKLIIHDCISPDVLIKQISKYHFGINIRRELDPDYKNEKAYTLNYLSRSGSSRITDYIEANLKIISNWHSKRDLCYFIPNRYSTCIDFYKIKNNPEILFKMIDSDPVKKKKTKGYTIEENINRLIKFYQL